MKRAAGVRGRARARRGLLRAGRRGGREDALPDARAAGRRLPAAPVRLGGAVGDRAAATAQAVTRRLAAPRRARRRPRLDEHHVLRGARSRAARRRRHGRVSRAARGRRARLAQGESTSLWVVLAATGVALLADGGGTAVQARSASCSRPSPASSGRSTSCSSVRVGRAFSGATGLAPAMALGALLMAPWGIISARASPARRTARRRRGRRRAAVVGAAVVARARSAAAPAVARLQRRAVARAGGCSGSPASSSCTSTCARGRGLRSRSSCLRAPARQGAGARPCRRDILAAGAMFWLTLNVLSGS